MQFTVYGRDFGRLFDHNHEWRQTFGVSLRKTQPRRLTLTGARRILRVRVGL